MRSLAHLVPPKVHDGNEGGFHEESHDTLNGQRSAEDIAHKPAVVAPVRAELKLQNDARSHAHGKIDAEELHPELRRLFPELASRAHIQRFHDGHDDAQPQGERHK